MRVASVGNDVGKTWFDVCVLLESEKHEHRFPNNSTGLKNCLKWLSSFKADQFNVVFEPTGRYSEPFAKFFSNCPAIRLYQVNPRKISEYRDSIDFRTVDDKKSAGVLAMFAEERVPRAERYRLRQYEPPTERQLALRDVRLRLRGLLKRSSALQNHLECQLKDDWINDQTKADLERVQEDIAATLDYARKIIDADPQLKEDVRRLDTILGIGEKTAIALVCLIDFRKFENSRALAIFCGLSNRRHTSGTSVRAKERISKAGNPEIRAALYYPAMSAIEDNPQMREFADRLKAKGKLYPVVRTAVSRKLIMLCWTLITKGVDYDSCYKGGPN